MSQYPSPYLPPNVMPYYQAPPDPLKPAKRAGILMFILGPILLLCGGCVMAMPAMLPTLLSMAPPGQAAQLQSQIDQAMENSQISRGMFATMMIIQGAMILIPGIALIVLAVFVRRGSKVATVLSIVLVGLILLFSVISLLGTLLHPVQGIGGACVDIFIIGLFVMLLVWLVSAVKATSSIKRAQQQYQAQYWQYQQNMQAYMGYGQQQQQMQPPPMGYPPQGQGGQGYAQAPPQQPPQLPPTSPPAQDNSGTPPQA